MRAPCLAVAALTTLSLLPIVALGAQVTAGQRDTFEDGTTQGWIVPDPGHPAPPTNVATGGPAGAGDGYVLLRSLGGNGPGSRMSAINFAQWTGDYRAAGVGAIQMDAANFGSSDLFLRLLIADPVMGPPSNVAISLNAIMLPAGSGWQRITFDLGPGGIGAVFGDAELAMQQATELRIFHNPAFGFGGPPNAIPPIDAQFGVDNITAMAVVPEPSTIFLVGTGVLLLPLLARRRRRVG